MERFDNIPFTLRQSDSPVLPVRSRDLLPLADAIRLLLLPVIVTALLWLTRTQEVSLIQVICAWLLFCFPCGAYLSWKCQRRYEVSLFAFVAAMYWLYFGVALFWGNRLSPGIWSKGGMLSDDAITQAMLMAVLGVASLWAGMQIRISSLWIPKYIPDIPSASSRWNYIRFVLVLGTFFSLFQSAAGLLGEAGRQLIYGLQDSVPLVAFIILFRHYLKGNAARIDKFLLLTFFLAKFAVGLSGGWLGSVVFVALACFILYLNEKRRPPWLAVAPILFYIIFFQAGKSAFRAESWYGGNDPRTIVEKMGRWTSLSWEAWEEAIEDPVGDKRSQLLGDLVMRASLLTQTAHVLELTPSQVPYQEGSTYSFLFAMWVPRALWPDKPSASEANRFYQVAYGLTDENDLDNVAIASGTVTESYINFGWFGVAGVMFLIGALFNWVQTVFLTRNAGALLGAVGIMMVMNFISIEAQMATYIGGLVQRTMLVLIVFLPIVHLRKFRG